MPDALKAAKKAYIDNMMSGLTAKLDNENMKYMAGFEADCGVEKFTLEIPRFLRNPKPIAKIEAIRGNGHYTSIKGETFDRDLIPQEFMDGWVRGLRRKYGVSG